MGDLGEEIAVVGIGCNFPGGEGLVNFWKVLLDGRNCVVQIPEERFDCSYWYDPDDSKPGKSYTKSAALISGFNEFDHKLFGIDDEEVGHMDPQQKLLLECSYRCLENAGLPVEKASGTRTGVFLGLMNRDYEQTSINPYDITHRSGTGKAMSIAANRISYTFNFTGPSMAIDSACSSSLVAVHLGCQAIKQGDCDMALCAGVSYILDPQVFVALTKAKMISPDGTSKPFSIHGDGYGRGEGCGIVLLKPLRKALNDFDHVWGVIHATAVNQDGRSVTPITRPSVIQQEELLHRIYPTQIDPSHIQYVEAHGTGTPAGDPAEAGSISKVIAKARSSGSAVLRIGSVKGNIGHTESAAGMAGLIKVLLMMHYEIIVPSLFYSEDSGSIDAQSLSVKIPTSVEKWEESGPFGRVAGVNNFGFGGTNAHVVVRQYKGTNTHQSNGKHSISIFVLSANTEKSIKMMMENTAQHLRMENTISLQDLTYTSACRRSHVKNKYRKAFVTSSLEDLEGQLKSCQNKKIAQSKLDPRLIFVFCGNGLTYRGMCKQLLREEPVFREKVEEIDSLFRNLSNTSILHKLQNDTDDFSAPDIVQPLLFAIQVAISSLLKHWGVRPDAIVGHSVGEVAAAHCAGLLSLQDSVKVIFHRSTLQTQVTVGKMLVVSNVAVSEILKLLPDYSGSICLAAFNSPQSCTLSGEANAIDSLHQRLESSFQDHNLFLRLLNVSAAYHSHLMDPILNEVEESIGSLEENLTESELVSTVTGVEFSKGDFSTGKYWARNVREPVAFEKAVKSASKGKKNAIFVEIGPRPALKRNIMDTLGDDMIVLPSVLPEKDREAMLTVVCRLFELGFTVKWEKVYKGYDATPTPFPSYEFDKRKIDSVSRKAWASAGSDHPVLTSLGPDRFLCNMSSDSTSYLYEHKNNGVPIIPGAFYVELALASCFANSKPKVPLSSLELSISFHVPFVLNYNSPKLTVQLDSKDDETSVKIFCPSATYASGSIKRMPQRTVCQQTLSLHSVYNRCTSILSSEEFYKKVNEVGFQYGSVFRKAGDLYCGKEFNEVISTVMVPSAILHELHSYCIHPVILDYLMQMAAVIGVNGLESKPGFPSSIGCVTVLEPLQEEMVIYLQGTESNSSYLAACGCITDTEGRILVELRNVKVTYLSSGNSDVKSLFFENAFTLTAKEKPYSSLKPKAFVFADELGAANALKKHLHPDSTYVSLGKNKHLLNQNIADFLLKLNVPDVNRQYKELLFMWGIGDLTLLKTEQVLEHLINFCDQFCQIVLKLKKERFLPPVRIITYKSTEITVDHISPGFALAGLTRACAAEIEVLTFQLIDIGSLSKMDIQALGQVIQSYECKKYPEVVISDGKIYSNPLFHTTFKTHDSRKVQPSESESFTLQTAHPYQLTGLSATPFSDPDLHIKDQMIEVQLNTICVHSSDYFPVSASDLNFGQTLYWSEHSSQNHDLLALDFSGKVTAVGRNVTQFKVGDTIVSCYPVVASTKLRIPESTCYNLKMLPFLKEVPCMSHFVMAWEILCNELPKVNQKDWGLLDLDIISSELNSNLITVFTATASKAGWKVVATTEFRKFCHNIVFLPPCDASSVIKACRCSSAKNIVVVCDNKVPLTVAQTLLRNEGDEVCIHVVHVDNIFRKSYLKSQRTQIYKWLMSIKFNSTDFSFQRGTFQTTTTRNTEPASYFNSKMTSLVVLEEKGKREMSNIPVVEKHKLHFQKNALYIVSGGLSGLGFETVKFLAERGGGHIVILSRRKPTHDMQEEIENVKNTYGVTVISEQCDISVTSQVTATINHVSQKFPKIAVRGVFHSAVVLHDGMIENLDKLHFEKVLKPKVNGVLNLHYATKNFKLDYFVCYSSISSCLGNAAQTNYCAANSFLDMFCHYRRKLGLAAQSINWGPLNLGLLLEKHHLHTLLESKGLMVMDVPEFHESLEECLLQSNVQQIVCKFSFKSLADNVRSQNSSLRARLSLLVLEVVKNAKQVDFRIQKSNTPSTPEDYVRSLLSEVFNIEVEQLSDDTTLTALGIDSMLAMTLQNRIYHEKQVRVPLVNLLNPNSTITALFSVLEETREQET